MTDLFFSVLITALAASAFLEFVDMVLERLVIGPSKSLLKKVLVLPACVGSLYLLGVRLPDIIVASMAAMLSSLIITMWLDKPVVVQRPVRRSLEGLL